MELMVAYGSAADPDAAAQARDLDLAVLLSLDGRTASMTTLEADEDCRLTP